ncbi:MAG: GNAT family N-acetyltransferase [Anaerolineae bacterium]|nr:GNAT family N-acetyltransferase [Anaerolineae bacterium]
MATVHVRQALLRDVGAISQVHQSWVGGAAALSLAEGWQQGGPCLAPETCAVWVAHLLVGSEGIPLVAELAGEVVGYAEAFIGQEAAPHGLHLNIASLTVHQASQGQGVGRALVSYSLEMARVLRCRAVTAAQPRPLAFFAALGFQPQLARYEVLLSPVEGRVFYRARELTERDPAQIRGWQMPLGRWQNARQEWEALAWGMWRAVPELVERAWHDLQIDLTGQPGILHLHETNPLSREAQARLWTKNPMTNQMLSAVLDRSARLGYQRLLTLVEEPLAELFADQVAAATPHWLYAYPIG